MVKVVAYGNNRGGSYLRRIGCKLRRGLFFLLFSGGFLLGFLDQDSVKLLKKENKKNKYCHRTEKGDPGIVFLFIV